MSPEPENWTKTANKTPAGVDGDVGAFTPLPGWAVGVDLWDALPVARQAAHAEQTTTHFQSSTIILVLIDARIPVKRRQKIANHLYQMMHRTFQPFYLS